MNEAKPRNRPSQRRPKKKAMNLTLTEGVVRWMDEIVEKRGYSSRSVLVEELIRHRHDQELEETR